MAFLEADRLVAADFNEKRIYLAALRHDELAQLDTKATVIADGTPVQTDLMDAAGDQVVVSNFYQGTASLYRVEGDRIRFEDEIDVVPYRGLHGVRFLPSDPSLLWLAFCGAHNRCHLVVDLRTRTVLHEFETDQQCQDIAFTRGFAIVFARTNHIMAGTKRVRRFSRKWRMFATAYIYRLPNDLRSASPVLVGRWKGRGHIDGAKAAGDTIYAANQYLDRIDVFDVTAEGRLRLVRKLGNMQMPHGLDVHDGRLAVTNYGDQTLRLLSL
ncbi:MAG: hypothetical protein AAFR35_16720 [Pseudomonadota bacterium]